MENTPNPVPQKKEGHAKRNLYIIILILAFISIIFRVLDTYGLEQTSLLFIGLPTLMSLLAVKYVPKATSAFGLVFQIITLFLLLSGILLGEGIICILFTAPIFYGVGAIMVLIYELLKKRNKSKQYLFFWLPFVLIIGEVYLIATPKPIQTVKTSQTVAGHPTFEAFNQSPDFLQNYPNFFKLGVPTPLQIEGTGIAIGDQRRISFESRTRGIGDLVLEVQDVQPNVMTFRFNSDDSHINHWLTWKLAKVELEHHPNETTTIHWTTQFTCDLGPTWYFVPIERHGIEVMNEHLIQAYFGMPIEQSN